MVRRAIEEIYDAVDFVPRRGWASRMTAVVEPVGTYLFSSYRGGIGCRVRGGKSKWEMTSVLQTSNLFNGKVTRSKLHGSNQEAYGWCNNMPLLPIAFTRLQWLIGGVWVIVARIDSRLEVFVARQSLQKGGFAATSPSEADDVQARFIYDCRVQHSLHHLANQRLLI